MENLYDKTYKTKTVKDDFLWNFKAPKQKDVIEVDDLTEEILKQIASKEKTTSKEIEILGYEYSKKKNKYLIVRYAKFNTYKVSEVEEAIKKVLESKVDARIGVEFAETDEERNFEGPINVEVCFKDKKRLRSEDANIMQRALRVYLKDNISNVLPDFRADLDVVIY